MQTVSLPLALAAQPPPTATTPSARASSSPLPPPRPSIHSSGTPSRHPRPAEPSTQASTEYIFNGDTLVSTVDQQYASNTATGTPRTLYIHPDHLGSTNVVTNASGTVVQTLDYYPYGGLRINSTSRNYSGAGRQYLNRFADQSGLDYLQARYYDPSRGQFTSQDPVFWGDPKDQDLRNPQSLNSYLCANDNPIANKDPNGKCIEDGCVIESLALIGGGIGVGGRYVGDIMEDRDSGMTGIQAFYLRSSLGQYLAAAGSGAAATVASAYSMGLASIIGAGGYAVDNQLAGKQFDPWKTIGVGALSYVGGRFFEWGVGEVPSSLFFKKATVGGMFDMNLQAILQNYLNSGSTGKNTSLLNKTTISNTISSQQSSTGKSTSLGSSQNLAPTAYLAGQMDIGNSQGAFIGSAP